MAIIAKKLSQAALSNTLVAQVTGAANKRTQVLQIWLTNTGATSRTAQLTAFGVAAANQLANSISMAGAETKIIDSKIVLAASDVLYAKQDTGTEITMTSFGFEEDV